MRSASFLDLGSSIGGVTLGARQVPGVEVVGGVDPDPWAVAVYRKAVGRARCSEWSEMHPPTSSPVDIVAATLPRSTGPYGGTPVPTSPGSAAWHAVRVAVESRASALVFYASAVRNLAQDAAFEHLMEGAGFYPKSELLMAHDYGVPQFRQVLVTVGFKRKSSWSEFRWPKRTHDHPDYAHDAKLKPWVTVRDALGIAFDEPSPTVRTTEHLGSWRGARGGSAKASRSWRACEVIAHGVGRAAWGPRAVCLDPRDLCVLQGLPPWVFNLPKYRSIPLIALTVPPLVSKVVTRQVFRAVFR